MNTLLRQIASVAVVSAVLIAASSTAPAATLTVTSTADSGDGSLRDAVAAAQNGDTIVFHTKLKNQTITLTGGELVVATDLVIDGRLAPHVTVSGDNASRVFHIDGGATVTIANLTIADGLVVDDRNGTKNRPRSPTWINPFVCW